MTPNSYNCHSRSKRESKKLILDSRLRPGFAKGPAFSETAPKASSAEASGNDSQKSDHYRVIDRRYLWHPYSRHSAIANDDFPVIVRGQGPYLFDCEGKRYFDAISSWWCCNLGHNHPRIVKVIRAQAGKLQHSILGNMSHPPAIELAEKIAGLIELDPTALQQTTLSVSDGRAGPPCPAALTFRRPDWPRLRQGLRRGEQSGPTSMESKDFKQENRRVFFSSDGSSAVEAAIKIAVQYWHNIGQPERYRLVSLEGAYHGDTLGAVSAGYLPHFHQPFKHLLFPVLRAAAPDCAECAEKSDRLDGSIMGKTGQACDCECFKSMRQIIEKHGHEIAAVIIEPLCQCAAGMRIYPPAYLKKLAQLCRDRKILLIADEIAVGFGRTGTMFAFEQAGIEPDIICLGKGLSGGYLPISATVVKESIYAAFSDSPPIALATGGVCQKDNTFYHGHTFAGNPIACAAALEVLKIYREEGIVSRAARNGRALAEGMKYLSHTKGVRNARWLGMIAAFEVDKPARASAVRQAMLEAGVLIRPLGNTIYLMPPLNTPEKLLGKAIDLLGKTLEEVK